jgi:hypothetical protein
MFSPTRQLTTLSITISLPALPSTTASRRTLLRRLQHSSFTSSSTMAPKRKEDFSEEFTDEEVRLSRAPTISIKHTPPSNCRSRASFLLRCVLTTLLCMPDCTQEDPKPKKKRASGGKKDLTPFVDELGWHVEPPSLIWRCVLQCRVSCCCGARVVQPQCCGMYAACSMCSSQACPCATHMLRNAAA